MESTSPSTAVGRRAEDLPELAEMVTSGEPVATVVVPTEREAPDAAQRFRARWADVRGDLAAQGAPGEVIDRIGTALAEARLDGEHVAVAASRSRLVRRAHDGDAQPVTRWGALPALTTFVAWEQATPPGVLAVVDRTGADLFATGAPGPVEVVEGESGPLVHRGAPGGWSQRRFQQRAERIWRVNAGVVAEELQQVAERVDARVLVLAGDERAVVEVVDQLPADLQPLVRRASGGRGKGSEGRMADDVRRWYRTAVAEDTVALIRDFVQELGRDELAVAGLDATTRALQLAAVETLLVHDGELGRKALRLRRSDPAALSISTDPSDGEDVVQAPAPDALIAAAWASGAGVRIVPTLRDLADGVAAVLRFSVEPPDVTP